MAYLLRRPTSATLAPQLVRGYVMPRIYQSTVKIIIIVGRMFFTVVVFYGL